jgi:hypothetical protein
MTGARQEALAQAISRKLNCRRQSYRSLRSLLGSSSELAGVLLLLLLLQALLCSPD